MRVSEASLRLLHETNALDRRGAPLTLVGEARASRRGFLARGSPLALAAVTRERLGTGGAGWKHLASRSHVDHNDRARS